VSYIVYLGLGETLVSNNIAGEYLVGGIDEEFITSEIVQGASFNFEAVNISLATEYKFELVPANFSFNTYPINITHLITYSLISTEFQLTGIPIVFDVITKYPVLLTTPDFNVVTDSLNFGSTTGIKINTTSFNISPIDIKIQSDIKIILGSTSFHMVGEPIIKRRSTEYLLSSSLFNFKGQKIIMADSYNLTFDTLNGTYADEGLVVELGGTEVASVLADGTHIFNVLIAPSDQEIKFKCKTTNAFIGDVDNVVLLRGFR